MSLVGKILIAPPAVKGNFWHKTVVLVTENHAHGSVGFVLNKRSQMTVKEFGEQLGIRLDLPGFVYLGGPVNVKSLSFLHTNDWKSKNMIKINDELSLSSSEEVLPRMAMGDLPKQWRLMLGLCGWGHNQLEGEIKGDPPWKQENSWCLANANLELVFDTDSNDQWCTALDKSGLEFAQSFLA
jgi:putative transcriptional regulator